MPRRQLRSGLARSARHPLPVNLGHRVLVEAINEGAACLRSVMSMSISKTSGDPSTPPGRSYPSDARRAFLRSRQRMSEGRTKRAAARHVISPKMANMPKPFRARLLAASREPVSLARCPSARVVFRR